MSNHKRRHSSPIARYEILKCKALSKFSVKRIPCLFNKFFAPLFCIHVLCFDSLSKMSPPPHPLSPPPLPPPPSPLSSPPPLTSTSSPLLPLLNLFPCHLPPHPPFSSSYSFLLLLLLLLLKTLFPSPYVSLV